MDNRLRIKEVIKKYNLSINEIAKRMNISRVSLSTHIHGNPSVDVLLRIAAAIGCDVTELFETGVKKEKQIQCPYCGKDLHIKVE